MFQAPQLTPYWADMPLVLLCTPEAFLTTSLRLWNTDEADPERGVPRWRAGFAHARIELAGTLAFDRFCRMVAIAAHRPPQVRAFNCECLSADEALLLRTFGCLQHEDLQAACSALGQLCPAAAVRLAVGPALTVARSLSARRMRLPLRSGTDRSATALFWGAVKGLGWAH